MDFTTPIIALTELKKCEPENVLGSGSFGKVKLARHEFRGLVAVKWQRRIGSGFIFSRHNKEKVENEAKIHVASSHVSDHVVRCHGICFMTSQSVEYTGIVMEYMPGGTLHQLVFDGDSPLGDLFKLRALYEISCGVACLHNYTGGGHKRAVHGDLKPLNVLMSGDLRCKISDFGGSSLATCTGRTSDDARRNEAGKESTWEYKAPERIEKFHSRLRRSMDVYSFAIVAYNLLTRKRPSSYLFAEGKTNDWKEIKKQYLDDITKELRPPLVFSTEMNNVENVFSDIIKKSWAHKPNERPKMNEIKNELEKELSKYSQSDILNSVLEIVKYREDKGKNVHMSSLSWKSYSSENSTKLEEENVKPSASSTFRFPEISDVFVDNYDLKPSKVLIIGGFDRKNKSGMSFTTEKKIQNYNSLESSRHDHTSCVFKNFVFNFGGKEGGKKSSVVQRVKLDLDDLSKWDESHMDYDVTNCKCSVVQDRILVTGGKVKSQFQNKSYIYDPYSDTWAATKDMNEVRCYHGMVTCNGRCFCFGGFDGKHRLDTIESFDPREGRWVKEKAKLLQPLVKFGCDVINNTVHVMGGYNDVVHNTTQHFDVRNIKPQRSKAMNLARKDFGCCLIDEKIIVVGGDGSEISRKTAEYYDSNLNKWNLLFEFDESLYRHTVVAL